MTQDNETTPKILTGTDIWLDMEGSYAQKNEQEFHKTGDQEFISIEYLNRIIDKRIEKLSEGKKLWCMDRINELRELKKKVNE